MSVRRGPGAPAPAAVQKSRLHQVLSAGQDQQKIKADQAAGISPSAPVKAATGGGPFFYVGQGDGDCERGVYCDRDGKPKSSGSDDEDPYPLPPERPPDEMKDYIEQVLDNLAAGPAGLLAFSAQLQATTDSLRMR